MTFVKKSLAITLAVATCALSAYAFAEGHKQSPEESAVAYRQAAFTMIRHHFGAMGAMVKGDKPFDAAEFSKNAEAVAALSKFPANGFIAGSYSVKTDTIKTEAKPKIEQNADDFKKKMDTFQVEATALVDAAKAGNMDTIKPQFGKVGESCKACHKEYKED